MNAKAIVAVLSIFLFSGPNCAWAEEARSISTGSLASELLWAILAGMVIATASCVVDAVLRVVAEC